MQLVAIGDKIPPGTYHLHSRFAHVVNYGNDSAIISFVDSEKNLSGRTLFVSDLPQGKEPVHVCDSHVAVGTARVSRTGAQVYDSSFQGFDPGQDLSPLVKAMKSALDFLVPDCSLAVLYHPRQEVAFASSFEKVALQVFRRAFESCRNGDILGSVAQFRGVGFGLTPSGDDFITGLLYALSSCTSAWNLHDIKQGIRIKASGGNPLSWQFMCDAEGGIFPKNIKELFISAQKGDDAGMNVHLKRILQHGHTSGADTIAGMIAAFEWLAARQDLQAGGRARA